MRPTPSELSHSCKHRGGGTSRLRKECTPRTRCANQIECPVAWGSDGDRREPRVPVLIVKRLIGSSEASVARRALRLVARNPGPEELVEACGARHPEAYWANSRADP